jgi:hypothetical protein
MITIQVLLDDASDEFGCGYALFAGAGLEALCIQEAQADKEFWNADR